MIKPDSKFKKLLLAGFVIILLLSGVKVVDKALEDRTAFLRWDKHTESILEGETVYGEKGGKYPNLPFMLMILIPFHAMEPVAGSIAWLLFKFAIIVFIFRSVKRVAENHGPPLPDWALFLLLVLSMRVFMSDLTHGNINLIIGGLIVCAMLCSYHQKDFLSGLSIGLATVLKVTPALFIPYFLYKRKWTSLAGSFAGIALFCWLIPGLFLGFEFNNQLVIQWYKQMIHPFIAGMPVGYMQTQHMNQSFTGIFYRLLSDCTAIAAEPKEGLEALKINLLSLDQKTVSLIVKGASLAVVAALAWFCRTPRSSPKHLGHLGEFAMVFLAMLFLSERSWKHHYILLILSHGFLLYYFLIMRPSGRRKWVPLVFTAMGIFLHTFTSSAFFGSYLSDVLEAYGVFVIGALFLFISCASVLTVLRREGWPDRPSIHAKT
ncbi:MAG: glycosyltransferase family 87 protein [Desulfosalsimonadaceae bacterium]